MEYVIELHPHSKYATACSEQLTLEGMADACEKKGIQIIGSADFTHPLWFNDMKQKLEEDKKGVYKLKGSKSKTRFLLTSEMSVIFPNEKGGKSLGMFDRTGMTKRFHNCVIAPSLEVVEQINAQMGKFGNLSVDGRPMLTLRASEFIEILHGISKDIFVFPAHCLLPNEIVIMNSEVKEIQNIKKGEKVLTHTGESHTVQKVLSRIYCGNVFKIIPWYFSTGIEVTPEHPFFAIKTIKNCNGSGGICKPARAHIRNCYKHFYKNYKTSWISAENLEIGDVLVYPRLSKEQDIETISIERHILTGNFPSQLRIDSRFCRLAGYYLAEGYSNRRDGIGFSFNKDSEKEYVEEVKLLIKDIFKIEAKKGKTDGDVLFYSKNLMVLFEKMFYAGLEKNASTKCLPNWMLYISKRKQAELFRYWWRGDSGYTISRLLHNQFRLICLRLGIVPCIHIDTVSAYNRRGEHLIGRRKIRANHSTYSLGHLAFFEDTFGMLKEKKFKGFVTKTDKKHGWIDENFVYLPIRKISTRNYKGSVFNLEVEGDNSFLTESAAVHNCWTPWFGVFGSMSGFDSMEDAYEDQAMHIRALETGLSSDPAMNWRISKLDKYAILSGSDAHSLPKLGREATVLEFDEKDLSYKTIIDSIKEKKIKYTLEFYPEEGKYHFDGHRNCKVSLSPEDSARYNNICPVCRKPLTLGVMNRVNKLADREPGYVPKGAVPFVHAIPLQEVIAFVSKKTVYSMYVKSTYEKLIEKFGTEMNVLLKASIDEIAAVDKDIANAMQNIREDRVSIKPGYDGVFGVIDILNAASEDKKKATRGYGQKTL